MADVAADPRNVGEILCPTTNRNGDGRLDIEEPIAIVQPVDDLGGDELVPVAVGVQTINGSDRRREEFRSAGQVDQDEPMVNDRSTDDVVHGGDRALELLAQWCPDRERCENVVNGCRHYGGCLRRQLTEQRMKTLAELIKIKVRIPKIVDADKTGDDVGGFHAGQWKLMIDDVFQTGAGGGEVPDLDRLAGRTNGGCHVREPAVELAGKARPPATRVTNPFRQAVAQTDDSQSRAHEALPGGEFFGPAVVGLPGRRPLYGIDEHERLGQFVASNVSLCLGQ